MSDFTYMHVTAEFTHLVEDGMVDLDANPDEVGVSGSVRFIPMVDPNNPAWPTGNPTRSVTVSEISGVVAGGVLEDMQGREGVWLVATIGGRPIRWTAHPELRFNNQIIPSRDITFYPPEDGNELRLNDVAGEPEIGWAGQAPTPVNDLYLPTVGDYTYTYKLSSDAFDEDAELFYLFGEPPTPSVRWDFLLEDDLASIHKLGIEVADVAPGTRYWLMFKANATAPTRELMTGVVRKVNA